MQRALEVLEEAPYAYLAVIDKDRPYVVPVNFAYDPTVGRLYFHTGAGRKSTALAGTARVCLAIAIDATFRQGATPCSDGFAFRSTLVEGKATLLRSSKERETALRAIVTRYDPGAADEPFDPDVFAKTLVYAVAIEAVTYKELPRSPGD